MRRPVLLTAFVACLTACGRPSAPEPGLQAPPVPVASSAPEAGEPSAPVTSAVSSASPPRWVEASPDVGLLALVRTERLAALAAGELPVVYVGARWCPPCQRFERSLREGAFATSLAGVRFLHVDLDERRDDLVASGYTSRSIPFFVVPRPDGRPSERRLEVSAKGETAAKQIIDGLRAMR